MTILEIQVEREAQKARWSAENDQAWTPGEWAALVSHYATRSVSGNLRDIDVLAFRADMVKAAALALGCIEALDRKAQ
jgi:hypothetical protein